MRQKTLGWVLTLLAATLCSHASAGNPFVEVPSDFASTPAHAYAEMTAHDCYRNLDDRGIAYQRVKAGSLVDAPVQLSGPLQGVMFTHVHPRESGAKLDCRLALALNDFASTLKEHHVVEVGYLAAYRPNASGHAKPGQRHPAGLAMDIAWFQRDDGQRFVVQSDYEGHVGSKTCGLGAQTPTGRKEPAAALRKLICDTAKARLFHLFLTPNYDRDHHDHVHVEVRRNTHWFLVQ